jgi:hypothetical protein
MAYRRRNQLGRHHSMVLGRPGRRVICGVSADLVGELPGFEDGVEGGGGVSNVAALPVQVEAERFRSTGSLNRCSSLSRTAPWLAWMSRSAPPAPIGASC